MGKGGGGTGIRRGLGEFLGEGAIDLSKDKWE